MKRIQIYIILGYLLTLQTPVSALEQSIQQRAHKAQLAYQNGKLNEAIIELRILLQDQPHNSSLRGLLGRWYLERGDNVSAERELNLAKQKQTVPNPDFLLDLARSWLSQKSFHRVLLELNSNPSFNTAQTLKLHIFRARAFANLNFPDRAKDELQRANEIHKGYWEIALERARISLLGNRPKEAIKQLSEIPAQHQNHSATQMLYALAYERGGDLSSARKALNQALELTPTLHTARSSRMWISLALGDDTTLQQDIDYFLSLDTNDRVNKHFLAFKAFLDGRYSDAQIELTDLLNIHPEHHGSNILLALTHLAQHNYEQTIKILQPFTSRFPTAVGIRLALADALIQAERPNRALGHLNEVLDKTPGHPQASKLATRAYSKLDRLDESIKLLRQAVAQNPNDAALQAQLALSRAQAGRADQTERKLLQRLEEHPQDITALTSIGAVKLQNNEFKEARRYFQKGLAAHPNHAYLQQLIAISHIAENNSEAAWPIVEKGLNAKQNFFESAKLLTLLYLENREIEKAGFLIEKLLETNPQNAEVHNLHGALSMSRGNEKQAAQDFTKAIKLRPTFLGAYVNLAILAMHQQKPEQALAHYEAALEHAPNSARIRMLAANIAKKLNKREATLEHMQRAYTAQSDSKKILLEYTQELLNQGNYDDALHVAKDTTRQYPLTTAGWRNLAISEVHHENIEGARAASDTMLSLAPNSADATFVRAQIERRANNPDQALKWIEKSLLAEPNNFEANKAKAEISLLRGDGISAHASALVLQREYPNSAVGFALEGNLLTQTRQFSKAVQAYTKATELAPRASYVIALSKALEKSGQLSKAQETLENWIPSNPSHREARETLALIWYKRGLSEKAANELESLLTEQPDELRLLNNIAWIYSDLNDNRALLYAKRAYSLSPATAAIADTYGWLLAKNGKPREAIDLLRQASETEPEKGKYRYHLAIALSQAGLNPAAKIEVQNLIDNHPDFASKAKRLLSTLP